MNPPRTEAVHQHLRNRTDFAKTDHQVWFEHAQQLELENQRLRKAGANLYVELSDIKHKLSKLDADQGDQELAEWNELTKS